MQYEEMRKLVKSHFAEMLASRKRSIREEGPLSALDLHLLQATVDADLASGAKTVAERMQLNVTDEFLVRRMCEGAGVSDELTPEVLRRLIVEYRRADASYSKALLEFDAKVAAYEFVSEEQNTSGRELHQTPLATATGSKLKDLVAEHTKYMGIENQWSQKTRCEKVEHFALLFELLGEDVPVENVRHPEARAVRDTLVRYPVNRNKMAATRGKSLEELASIRGLRTISPLTVNKYLQTYSGLFGWAVRNGFASLNPFENLALRTDKMHEEAPRLAFSDQQTRQIVDALTREPSTMEEHHKWGTLIAVYTGARLNEIAQLHLDDVREVDGVWCFDINQNGERKKLKNKASKRLVPLHPKLASYGFFDYLQRMTDTRGNQRLFPRLTFTTSDGYGRNLGRWVNERFLPSLGIKTKQLTFHSFRHTMVRKLIAAEVPQAHVMALVGHEPGTTTLKVYNRGGFPPRQLLNELTKAL